MGIHVLDSPGSTCTIGWNHTRLVFNQHHPVKDSRKVILYASLICSSNSPDSVVFRIHIFMYTYFCNGCLSKYLEGVLHSAFFRKITDLKQTQQPFCKVGLALFIYHVYIVTFKFSFPNSLVKLSRNGGRWWWCVWGGGIPAKRRLF